LFATNTRRKKLWDRTQSRRLSAIEPYDPGPLTDEEQAIQDALVAAVEKQDANSGKKMGHHELFSVGLEAAINSAYAAGGGDEAGKNDALNRARDAGMEAQELEAKQKEEDLKFKLKDLNPHYSAPDRAWREGSAEWAGKNSIAMINVIYTAAAKAAYREGKKRGRRGGRRKTRRRGIKKKRNTKSRRKR
jgi:hypothetical protein